MTNAPASPKSWMAWLIVIGLLVRLLVGAWVGLGYGEAYHFSGAIRPALSYFDHPPLTFWLGWLGLKAWGQVNALAIRLPFILLFTGTTWLTFVLGRRLFGPWPGFYAALLLNISAVFTWSTATFVQPDGPLMFFWLACLWCLVRILFDNPPRPNLWWAGAGLCLGLAFLSKYHAVFIPLGVLAFILTSPGHRAWLARPGPYLALIIALLLSSPVLIWNAQHDWISFAYQLGRGAKSGGLRLDWLARNILGQSLDLLPWIWVPLLGSLWAGLKSGPRDRERWFIVCLALGPILLFTVISAYASIGYHFHWQAPGYLVLFLALGAALDRRLRSGEEKVRRRASIWLKSSLVFTCLALVLIIGQAVTGFARPAFHALAPPKRWATADPTLELLDWTPLAGALKERGLLGRKDLFLFTNRWFAAGKIDYALKGKMPVVCFSAHDPRSFAFYDRPENWMGRDGILILSEPHLYHPLVDYKVYFTSIEPLGQVELKRMGRTDKVLHLYYCRKMIKPFLLAY